MNRQTTFMVATNTETSASIRGAGFAAGEVGLFKLDGTNTGAAVTWPGTSSTNEYPLFVAQKTAFDAKVQPTIKSYIISNPVRQIKSLRKSTPVAEVGQITYVGFNGTTGDISYDCETEYSFKMVFNSPWIHKHYGTDAGLTHTVSIVTDCCADCDAGCGTATCYTETLKFVNKINDTDPATAGYAFSIYNFVGAELVVATTADTLVTASADGTATFTQGSTTVSVASGGNLTIADGDLLRITTAAAQPSDSNSVVYEVATGVTAGTTFELVNPWQGATVTIAFDNATIGNSRFTHAVPANITACGIKLTGKFISNTNGCCCFPPFAWDVEGVTFIVTNSLISSFPCTFDVTYASDLVMGQGTYLQLLYEEIDALGYSDVREFFKDCALNVTYQSQLTAGETYTVFYLDYVLPVDSPVVSSNYDTNLRLTIAVPTGTGTAANIQTMLNLLAANAGIPQLA